jgi:hypothetical protein
MLYSLSGPQDTVVTLAPSSASSSLLRVWTLFLQDGATHDSPLHPILFLLWSDCPSLSHPLRHFWNARLVALSYALSFGCVRLL